MKVIAHLGLGSNLEDPEAQIQRALQALAALPRSRLLAASRAYRSAPQRLTPEAPAQPDYINGVATLETRLGPRELLTALQQIEARQGRIRAERWGPRTLDLDLLLYGDLEMRTPDLTIPHPQIAQRAFVLLPLRELEGETFPIPGQGPLGALLAACPGTAEPISDAAQGGQHVAC